MSWQIWLCVARKVLWRSACGVASLGLLWLIGIPRSIAQGETGRGKVLVFASGVIAGLVMVSGGVHFASVYSDVLSTVPSDLSVNFVPVWVIGVVTTCVAPLAAQAAVAIAVAVILFGMELGGAYLRGVATECAVERCHGG